MLVLNTTSPRASPSAPAAAPRRIVPSSSARTASMGLISNAEPARGLVAVRSRAARTQQYLLPSARAADRESLLERCGDAVLFVGDDADGGGPAPVAVVFEPDRMRSGADAGQR